MRNLIILSLIISILVFLSASKALYFHFWRDDWVDLWLVSYKPSYFLNQGAAAHLHPGSAIEKFLGVYVFGLNPFFWQLFGLILKILSSFGLTLMMLGMTGSRKVAYTSGIIFASFFVGLESFIWVSAHTSAIFITFFCVGFYFWVSGLEHWKWYKIIVSFLFLVLAFSVTPARSIPIMLMVLFWDLLLLIRLPSMKLFKRIIFRNGLLLFFIWIIAQWMNSKYHTLDSRSLTDTINRILNNYNVIGNFFNSLGNLFIGWYYKAGEVTSLTIPNSIPLIVGLVYFFITISLFILFLIHRTKSLQIVFFLFIWIIITYFPSWMFGNGLTLAASHRYLTISALGLAGLVAYFISGINKRFRLSLTILVLTINVLSSNMYLNDLYKYRSFLTVDSIWNQIDKEVPSGEKNSIFIYLGKRPMLENILVWSGSAPFGMKRNLTEQDDFPIVTGDEELIKKLICQDNIDRPSLDVWTKQKNKIPFDHIHAWFLDENGRLENISGRVKKEIALDLTCIPI